MLASANLAVRFALELCLFAVAAWWGADTGGIALAVAVPLAVAVVWGVFVSPKARVRVGEVGRALIEAALFLAGAVALLDLGHPALAAAFAAAALVSGTLDRTLTPPAWVNGGSPGS